MTLSDQDRWEIALRIREALIDLESGCIESGMRGCREALELLGEPIEQETSDER